MIKLIGLKRIIILAIMAGINALCVVGYFLAVEPMISSVQADLAAVNGQAADLQQKLSTIQNSMVFMQKNRPKYAALRERGFFKEQNRFVLNPILDDLRKKTDLSSFSFSVSGVKEIPNSDADDMGYKLISSTIAIDKIETPLDTDIYSFLQKIADIFPEHTRILSFEIKRASDLNADILQKISEGKPAGLMQASVKFDWMTLVPKAATSATGASGAGTPPVEFGGR